MHEGVRYPCSECNYAATTAWDLKKHVENKHIIGVKYPCTKCPTDKNLKPYKPWTDTNL
jgi:hypothetical protein